ncbi:MAG: SIMPL domain-containing protein [Zoogloea sp.]|uniref:SIMPL domain-containing protein n=1 Tax=Zoogloea sp. TaxID=49181 RepID=UPI00262927D5|nr:SIMPL domain-containing protein [Zoogloea sp.]MDD2990273.1 SIMPL domain-containing protein [Zoogloea sp.]
MTLRLIRPLALLAFGFVLPHAHAADAPSAPALPTADISVESSRSAPNDLFRAQVYAEATDANPGDVARKVNAIVTQAISTAKGVPAVKVRSAGNSTYPVYGKTGRSIEAWRMRSTLALESNDAAALSELLGKLQQSMAVAGLSAAPSPETWKKIEDEAIADALGVFEGRARLVAGSLKKKWKIKHLSINTGGMQPKHPVVYARAAMMADAAPAPAPIEAGDSPVTVNVSGQIELIE